jgi:hypothetical protein
MSYMRDPDYKTRGVGAIAARDARLTPAQRLRMRQRAIGGLGVFGAVKQPSVGLSFAPVIQSGGGIDVPPQGPGRMPVPEPTPPGGGGGVRPPRIVKKFDDGRLAVSVSSVSPGRAAAAPPARGDLEPVNPILPTPTPPDKRGMPTGTRNGKTVPPPEPPLPDEGGGGEPASAPLISSPAGGGGSGSVWTPPAAPSLPAFPGFSPAEDLPPPSGGLSTGAKVALVGGGIALAYLLLRKRR